MGIKFACAECGHVLHVKSALAGKRGFCPKCQARVEIPAEGPPMAGQSAGAAGYDTPESVNMSVESAASVAATIAPVRPAGPRIPAPIPISAANVPVADPIAENPEMQWYVVPPGAATPYGPATGTLFRSWIDEGRVTADSLVWRQDWKDWQPANLVLPQFRTPVPAALPPLPGSAVPALAEVAPALVAPALVVPGLVAAVPGSEAPAASEPVDEQLTTLATPRRKVNKPRDYTNLLIIILAIGVLVMLPLMYLALK